MRRRNRIPADGQTNIDSIGKIVVLTMSVAFVVLALWLIATDRLKRPGYTLNLFYALMIILGGPIAYFFASATTRIELNSPSGRAWFGGGYAVSVFAVLFATRLVPPQHVYHLVRLNNIEEDVPAKQIAISEHSPAGAVFEDLSSDSGAYQFLCHFQPGSQDIKIRIKFSDDADFYTFVTTIRADSPPAELTLIRNPLGSNGEL